MDNLMLLNSPVLPVATEYHFPSGRIVISNDLRSLVTDDTFQEFDSKYELNTAMGLIQLTRAYSERGLFYAFVGNTSPQIYWNAVTNTLIAPSHPEFEFSQMQYVTQVCTGLRWVSMMDYDHYLTLGGTNERLEAFDAVVVEITPGRYIGQQWYGLVPYSDIDAYFTLTRSDADLPVFSQWQDAFSWLNVMTDCEVKCRYVNEACGYASHCHEGRSWTKIMSYAEMEALTSSVAELTINYVPITESCVDIFFSGWCPKLRVPISEFLDLMLLAQKVDIWAKEKTRATFFGD